MSISIDSGMFGAYPVSDTLKSSSNTKNLERTLAGGKLEDAGDAELMEACKSFEAYFVEQVFKEMKQTVHSDIDDNEYIKYFGDMMTEQYAQEATKGSGMGIAQMLYESMKR